MKNRLFFDTEFTGLHQNTTLISLGIVSDNGKSFYAEFTDLDLNQVDDWIKDNVLSKLSYISLDTVKDLAEAKENGNNFFVIETTNVNEERRKVAGNTEFVRGHLEKWLSQFGYIEIWSDCYAYDWVLFNQIWGHAFNIPKNINYIPHDLSTYFTVCGINPDVNRESFLRENNILVEQQNYSDFSLSNGDDKHNALWDAKVIRACFDVLQSMHDYELYEDKD